MAVSRKHVLVIVPVLFVVVGLSSMFWTDTQHAAPNPGPRASAGSAATPTKAISPLPVEAIEPAEATERTPVPAVDAKVELAADAWLADAKSIQADLMAALMSGDVAAIDAAKARAAKLAVVAKDNMVESR